MLNLQHKNHPQGSMMKAYQLLFILPLLTATASPAETVRVASLNWPPYACEKGCPENGSGAKALRAAYGAVGITVQFTWLPWSRAIADTKTGKYDAFFISWPEDCVEGMKFSEKLLTSPLGIMEQTAKPIAFKKTEDLKAFRIGSVQDYGNTLEFNALVKQGIIKTELVQEDSINIRKIAAGRLDGAVMDTYVLKYFLKTDFKEFAGKVRMNEQVLEEKPLGLCIPNAAYARWNTPLKAGLVKVDTKKINSDYLKEFFK
jgi:polar amino acid transport system substrate-binding protein